MRVHGVMGRGSWAGRITPHAKDAGDSDVLNLNSALKLSRQSLCHLWLPLVLLMAIRASDVLYPLGSGKDR